MKNSYIPVNNIDKAIAFANTLDYDFITKNQQIQPVDEYIKTIDIIEQFQERGWVLDGVCEQRNKKSKKIENHFVRMKHNDINSVFNNRLEGVVTANIHNSCDGSKPLDISLGMFRLVCSNGLISYNRVGSTKIKHVNVDYNVISSKIDIITNESSLILNQFESLRDKDLDENEMNRLAFEAALLVKNDVTSQDIQNLLKINRFEDEGNNLYNVFNRVQENLTSNIASLKVSNKVNTNLTKLALSYL